MASLEKDVVTESGVLLTALSSIVLLLLYRVAVGIKNGFLPRKVRLVLIREVDRTDHYHAKELARYSLDHLECGKVADPRMARNLV